MDPWQACREDALKRSEEMLESDAIKFDQFLRDNEAQVNAAIRDADMEAKKRQDRQVGSHARDSWDERWYYPVHSAIQLHSRRRPDTLPGLKKLGHKLTDTSCLQLEALHCV